MKSDLLLYLGQVILFADEYNYEVGQQVNILRYDFHRGFPTNKLIQAT